MNTAVTTEKSRERIEKRTAFICDDIECLDDKNHWKSLCSIRAINNVFTTKTNESNQWHYYIYSKKLTADELLKHCRNE